MPPLFSARRTTRRSRAALAAAGILLWSAAPVSAQETATPAGNDGDAADAIAAPAADLTQLSLEDLMNVEITSVSKQKQRVATAPAAVTVITQEEIRRSGMNGIVELLRTVPGMHVAQLNAHVWEVGARGFSDEYSNKLLVLQDGRTLYNRAFGGVFWEMQDFLLPDLERIEVVRGPGATLWGSNAVNGVVNITSKNAHDTQGLLVNGRMSNQQYIGGLRYGGMLDDLTAYRVYGKYREVENFPSPGSDAQDGWEATHGGFRIDRRASADDLLTLQGDISRQYGGDAQTLPTMQPPFALADRGTFVSGGANLLARWTHTFSNRSELSVQSYVDRIYKHDTDAAYEQNTVDVELQHRFKPLDRHELTYGLGYRFFRSEFSNSAYISAAPETFEGNELSAFLQDDITIVPDRVHLILGAKVEENAISGWNVQPSARAVWTPSQTTTVWASVARAVRTPSVFESNGRLWAATMPTPSGIPARTVLVGNSELSPEKLTAYELGYRVQPLPNLVFDVAGYINVYDDLTGVAAGTPTSKPTPTPRIIVPLHLNDANSGETYGVELAARWSPVNRLHLAASYTLSVTHLHQADVAGDLGANGSPRNQAHLLAGYELTRQLTLHAGAYYVEQTSDLVPSYIRTDVGLAYRPSENLEIGVGVQNLLDDRHPEASNSVYHTATEVPRIYYAQLTMRY